MTQLQELRRVFGHQDHLLKPTHEAEGGAESGLPNSKFTHLHTHTKH